MSQPYVGEIRLVGFNFAPNGWHFCDGSLLPIAENEVLFQLIGTTYGGDGQETFALPDLRGRSAMGVGIGPGLSSRVMGEQSGQENVTLTVNQIPVHRHNVQASGAMGTQTNPANAYPAKSSKKIYGGLNSDSLAPNALSQSGGNQSHENRQPYLGMNYVISLYGIFPSQT